MRLFAIDVAAGASSFLSGKHTRADHFQNCWCDCPKLSDSAADSAAPAIADLGRDCGGLRRPVLHGGQHGVVDERDPPVASLYGYSGLRGGRPFANAQVGAEKVVVQYQQAHQYGALILESPDSLEPILKLAVKPLVVVVVIELLLQMDLLDMDQPETGPAPEHLSGCGTKR